MFWKHACAHSSSTAPGGITGCIDELRAHEETRSVEAYGMLLSFAAREPRATWRWAIDFGLEALRTQAGQELRDRMPAGAFDLVYTAMREDGLQPDAYCIRQGLISRARRWPTDVRVPQRGIWGQRLWVHVHCVVSVRAETHQVAPLLPVGSPHRGVQRLFGGGGGGGGGSDSLLVQLVLYFVPCICQDKLHQRWWRIERTGPQ